MIYITQLIYIVPGQEKAFDEFERRAARHEELRFRIAPDCKVLLSFNGIVTQSAIRKLISYLELSIGDFPKDNDSSSPQLDHTT